MIIAINSFRDGIPYLFSRTSKPKLIKQDPWYFERNPSLELSKISISSSTVSGSSILYEDFSGTNLSILTVCSIHFSDPVETSRYCCLESDLDSKNIYVIDEDGLDYLNSKYKDIYDIKSIRLLCNENVRLKRNIDQERINRDYGRFNKNLDQFDYWLQNNESLETLISDLSYIINDWSNTSQES